MTTRNKSKNIRPNAKKFVLLETFKLPDIIIFFFEVAVTIIPFLFLLLVMMGTSIPDLLLSRPNGNMESRKVIIEKE